MGLKQDRLKFLEQNQTTMCIPKNFARCFFVQLVFYVWLVDYSILLTARQDEFIHVFWVGVLYSDVLAFIFYIKTGTPFSD